LKELKAEKDLIFQTQNLYVSIFAKLSQGQAPASACWLSFPYFHLIQQSGRPPTTRPSGKLVK
jgi:hypothetical protein